MEILVALLISALVMTSVLTSLDYTRRAVDAVHNLIERESVGPRVMALFQEDLSRLAIYDNHEYRILKGEDNSIGGADADRIDFLVYRRSTRPHLDFVREEKIYSPLVEVGYRLRQNRTIGDFMELYRREDFLHDEEPFKDGENTLLYDRILRFELLYYERPEIDPTWEDEWDSHEMEALPYAIELRMELEVQPRRSMESLAILGKNQARMEFDDILTIPESQRWTFRNRLHPLRHGAEGGEPGEGGDPQDDLGGVDAASSTVNVGGRNVRIESSSRVSGGSRK